MSDMRKSKAQLIEELAQLRQRVDELQAGDDRPSQPEGSATAGSERSQEYLDLASVIFVALNAKGQVDFINKRGSETLGYEQGKIIGKNWFDHFLPPSIKEETRSVFHQLMAGKLEWVEYFENPILTKNGKERIIAWHNTTLRDENDNIIGTLSSGEDITERKQAESALQESESSFRAMVDSLPDGVIIADAKGRHIFTNRRAAEITGYSKDELQSLSIDAITLPEELKKYRQIYTQRIEGKSVPGRYTRRIVCKDGTVISTELTTTTTRWQGQTCGMAIIHDITEREKASERIRLETETLTLINKLNAAANRGDTLKEIIDLFADLSRDIFSVNTTTVYLLDSDQEHLVMQNLTLPSRLASQLGKTIGKRFLNIHIRLCPGSIYAEIVNSGKARITNDIATIQQMMAECTENKALKKLVPTISQILNYRSVMSVPLVVDEVPIGLVDMSRTEPFAESELERFELLAEQLTAILSRKRMEDSLYQSLEETAYNQRLLLALSKAAEAIQRAHTPEAVYESISEQVAELGFDITVFSLSDDREYLTASHISLDPKLVQTAEKLTGLSAKGYKFPIKPHGFFWKIIQGEETVFTQLDITPVAEALPKHAHLLAEKLADMIDWRESIIAPLAIDGVVKDLLIVTGSKLAEGALPAVKAFANQAAIAIENARLLHETQQLATFNENIVQNMSEGIIVQNADGYFTFVNPSAAAMVGLEPHEIEGTHWTSIIPENLYAVVQAADERRLRGDTDRYELEIIHKDGHRVPILVSGSPQFENGKFIGSIAVFTDRSEFKRVEEERKHLLDQVHEQAQQLGQVMRTIPQGVLLVDADQRIILTNPVAQEQLAVLAGDQTDEKLSHLGDRPLSELLKPPKTRDMWHEVRFGTKIFEIIAQPIKEAKPLASWVLVIREVTRQREIQAQLQQQGQLAVVGQLASGIAHDFNNILSVITLYTEMGLGTPDIHPRLQVHLQTILQQARQATDLIQQILDFSRRTVIEQRPMDLIPFVKEAIKLLERTVPESIKLNLDYGSDEYTVYADPTRLQQVIMNLIVNSRDAIADRGEIQVTLSRGPIDEKIRCMGCRQTFEGEWIHIDVTDTGSGIAPNVLPHIFEPFFSTKPPGLGTGLGLPQVYGIVEKHTGHINVTTVEGEGTKFTIYLPPLAAQPVEIPSSEILETRSGQGELILVVEDDQILREALVESLESLDYRVEEAADGNEALGILEQRGEEVAMVLSDLVMPKMGGRALLEAMRARGIKLPMVMLSGHSLEADLPGLQELGIAGWLLKPPKIKELSQLLSEALRESSRKQA